jgi:hypothetical protein
MRTGSPRPGASSAASTRRVRLVQHQRLASGALHQRRVGGANGSSTRHGGRRRVLFPLTARAALLNAIARSHRRAPGRSRPTPSTSPDEPTGRREGKDSHSWLSPSWLTRLGERAARRNNQLPPRRSDGPLTNLATAAKERRHDTDYEGVEGQERWENLGRYENDDDRINVGRNERLISGVAGVALGLYSLRRKRLRGLLLPIAGSLISRAVTGRCAVNRAIGRNSALEDERTSPVASVGRGDGIKVEQAVTINRPREEIFRFWRNFENLPASWTT